MINTKYTKGGISIIGLFVFVIITVLVLNYFNINVRKVAQSPAGQENINYVKDNTKIIAKITWDKYLKDEFARIWNNVVKSLVKLFIDGVTGKSNFQETSQEVNSNSNEPPTNNQ